MFQNYQKLELQLEIAVNSRSGDNVVSAEWFVYVHEPGHMVHNSIYNFGSAASYTLINDNKTYIKLHEIQRKEVTYLNDHRTPCQSNPREENMDNCIQHYIESKLRCQLPWHTDKSTLPKCIENSHYRAFLDSYNKIAGLDGFSIAKKTGCLPSCKINEFTMTNPELISIPNEEAVYKGFFFYPGGRYRQKVYHYNYDFTSYIADVGGLVGLFLGYSMLGFYDGLKNAWRNKKI